MERWNDMAFLPTRCSTGACLAALQAAKAQLAEGQVQDWVPACRGWAPSLPRLQGRPLWRGGGYVPHLILMQRKTSVVESLKALELLERKGFLMQL